MSCPGSNIVQPSCIIRILCIIRRTSAETMYSILCQHIITDCITYIGLNGVLNQPTHITQVSFSFSLFDVLTWSFFLLFFLSCGLCDVVCTVDVLAMDGD